MGNASRMLVAVITDTLAELDRVGLHIPGGASFQELANLYLERRQQRAESILIEELRESLAGVEEKLSDEEGEHLVGILLRFKKAAEDGAASDNLRLLAQVIAGLKRNKALKEDAFKRWAGVVEALTRDDLIVLGHAYRVIEAADIGASEFWQALKGALGSAGYTNDEIESIAASLTRTGLLLPVAAWGGMIYGYSPWLRVLGELSKLKDKAHDRD